MTMRECREIFREEYADFIRKHRNDRIMINQEYTYFLDALCKDGKITLKQWDNAGNFIREKREN